MKTMKLLTVAALALAAFGFASTSASAQSVSAGNFDLVLGFEITDATGQGATTNLEIDLGAASGFISTASFNSLDATIGADLTSTYGSGWATRQDLVWGVGGVGSSSLGASSGSFDLTSQSALKTNTMGNLNSAFGQVGQLAGGLNNQAALTSPAAADVSNSNSNSWTGARQAGAGAGATDDFNMPGFSAGGQSEVPAGTSPDASLNLYTFTPNTNSRSEPLATLDGYFQLSGSGSSAVFAFNPTSTPEPSAYALGVCAVLLFVVLRRRSLIA